MVPAKWSILFSAADYLENDLQPGLWSRSFLGGFGFLRTQGVGFFYPTPDVHFNHFLHHTPTLGFRVQMV